MITFLLILAAWAVLAAVVAPLVGRGLRNGQHADLIADSQDRADARKRGAA